MRTIVLGLALLASPIPARAQNVELFVDRCRAGEVPSCNVAGLIYQTGAGEDADLSRAMDLYRLACAGGDPTGCTSIGLMYQNGRGVERDPSVAADQYRLACDAGGRFACDLLEALEADGPITERRPFFKAGRVLRDGTGEVLEGVLVSVPQLDLQLLSDERGRVELGRIPEGTYGVDAELVGYEPVSGVLNVPGYAEFVLLLEPIDGLEARRRGQVTGVVTDERRSGLPGVTVSVVEREALRGSTDSEGQFVLPAMAPGLWTIRFTSGEGASEETKIVVQPGRPTRIQATVTAEGMRFERP
jgi:hypothetical protein